MLGSACLLDKAHTAMYLNRIRGECDRPLGKPALYNRYQKRGALIFRRFFILFCVMGFIQSCPAHKNESAHRFNFCPHHREQAQHIRMIDNRRAIAAFQRRALYAVHGIVNSLLIGALGNRQPLKPYGKTGMVHHAKHNFQPFIFLAHQIAYRPAFFAILQHRCRRGFNAQLFFNRQAFYIITCTKAAIRIHQKFRHNKNRNPLHPFGRIGRACQNQMNDIFSHIMLTIGDIDFLAGNQIMIAIGYRPAFNGCQICSGLRLGQIHCPCPAPLDHWRQKQRFLGVIGRFLQGRNLALR